MAVRQYAPKGQRRTEAPPAGIESVPVEERAESETLIEDIDDLLDEIDSVLEEQSVLLNFRQRSGQ